jgi:hypothetical protein
VLVCLIGGSILISLGIIGSYLGKVFEEAKGRPLYVVERAINCRKELPGGHRSPGERSGLPRHVGIEHVS